DLRYFIGIGYATAAEDVKFKYNIDNSKVAIKYAVLTIEDIRKKYASELTVKDNEIDNEISMQKVKISDPNTDRERIKKQIEERKLEKIKNDLIEKVNAIASSGGSFDSAASILNGKILKSQIFKV